MTVSDVVDRYGYLMDEKQLEISYKKYIQQDLHNIKLMVIKMMVAYYDATRSHEWNTQICQV